MVTKFDIIETDFTIPYKFLFATKWAWTPPAPPGPTGGFQLYVKIPNAHHVLKARHMYTIRTSAICSYTVHMCAIRTNAVCMYFVYMHGGIYVLGMHVHRMHVYHISHVR